MKVIILHPNVHFLFSFVYVMYLNISSCLYGQQINLIVKVCKEVVFMNDFHLFSLEYASSTSVPYHDH